MEFNELFSEFNFFKKNYERNIGDGQLLNTYLLFKISNSLEIISKSLIGIHEQVIDPDAALDPRSPIKHAIDNIENMSDSLSEVKDMIEEYLNK